MKANIAMKNGSCRAGMSLLSARLLIGGLIVANKYEL